MSQVQVKNSRFTIIDWINDTLLLPLSKIEELGAGNVYCQILDAGYPDRVPLHKVKWGAKVQVEFLHNFKILQTSFQFLGIQKKINAEKLAKAKYQENLEFVQWLKSFVQNKINFQEYEPLKRRNFAKPYLGFAGKKKFNVTCVNKQNIQNSFMRSSLKSNVSMRSSKMRASNGLLSNLTEISFKSNNLILKTEPDEPKQNENIKASFSNTKNIQKRKNVRQTAYLALRATPKAPYIQDNDYLKPTIVSNVNVIESEGSDEEVF